MTAAAFASRLNEPQAEIPAVIEDLMQRPGTALGVGFSSGKDSHAMLLLLRKAHAERGWRGKLFAIHADLGKAEWQEQPDIPGFVSTEQHVKRVCADLGIDLVVVRRSDGRDMVDHWEARMLQLETEGRDVPFWSSAQSRYCTSDLKREPINKYLRRFDVVISAEGIRADESTARAKKTLVSVRKQITSKLYANLTPEAAVSKWKRTSKAGRLALTWNPILRLNVREVLRAIGTSWWELRQRQERFALGNAELEKGNAELARQHYTAALDGWVGHPAYVAGSSRLSCALCVLASLHDLTTGARWNRPLLRKLVSMEDRSGKSFQNGRWLRDIERQLEKQAA